MLVCTNKIGPFDQSSASWWVQSLSDSVWSLFPLSDKCSRGKLKDDVMQETSFLLQQSNSSEANFSKQVKNKTKKK